MKGAGLLFYPTRAVTRDADQSVARLCAQLAAGLAGSPYSLTVVQAAPAAPPPGDGFALESLREGVAARVAVRLLKAAGAPASGGRLRRRAWYRRAADRAAARTDRAPRFAVTCQAESVPWLRRGLGDLPLFLWLHDMPRGPARAAGLEGARQATAVVVGSESMRERLWQRLAERGHPAASWLIRYPVDETCFRPAGEAERRAWRASFDLPAEVRALGFASSLASHKGLATVLTALHGLRRGAPSPLPPLRLLVAGDANDDADGGGRLRALARAYGVDLAFTGRLAPARLREYYVALDALLVPSVWAEPYGMVALEALACGTPVLASRAGGLAEICRDRPGARLVSPPTAPAAWARALAATLGPDPPPRPPGGLEGSIAEGGMSAFLASWRELFEYHLPSPP